MGSPLIMHDPTTNTSVEVHPDDFSAALNKGYAPTDGVVMTDPKGQMVLVDHQDAAKALKANYTVGQPAVAKSQIGKASLGSVAREGALGVASGAGVQESQSPVTDTVKSFLQSSAEQDKQHPILSSIIPGFGTAATLLSGNTAMAKQTGQDVKEGLNATTPGDAARAAYKTAIHGIGSIVPMIGPAAVNIGEGIGTGIQNQDPNEIAHGVGQGAGLIGTLAMGTKKGAAATDTAISKIGGGAINALDKTAGTLLPDAAYNKLPDFLQSSGNVAKIEAKAVTKQAANLSSALEMGGKPEKGVQTYEHIAVPIADDIRTVAAQQGITPKDFQGRNGYVAAEKLTNGVRQQYDAAYNDIIDPLRGERADVAAKQASLEAVNKIIEDASLMDQLTRSNSVDQVLQLRDAIAQANTVGELDDMRIATNRLASKFMGKTEGQQYTSPILQQALDGASDAIRNSLYKDIAQRYGGAGPVNGESSGISEPYIRELQQRHGAAIKADQLMQQTARGMSSVASGEAAGPAGWRVGARLGYRATMGSAPHAAAGVMEKLFSGSDLDLFNTRMKRVLKGVKPDPNAAIPFQKPPETPEYVGPKDIPDMSTGVGQRKLPAAPPFAEVLPPQPKPLIPGLPSGRTPLQLSGSTEFPVPPHNPARILPRPGETPKALPPISLPVGGPDVQLTNSVEAVGMPQTAEPAALANVVAKRAESVYRDPQSQRTIEQAGGKYLGSGSGLSYFNFDDHSTTLAVPDNASVGHVQAAIEQAMKRSPKAKPVAEGSTSVPVAAPEQGTGSEAQQQPTETVAQPAKPASNLERRSSLDRRIIFDQTVSQMGKAKQGASPEETAQLDRLIQQTKEMYRAKSSGDRQVSSEGAATSGDGAQPPVPSVGTNVPEKSTTPEGSANPESSPEKVAAKEPWQMTREEFAQDRQRAYVAKRGGSAPSRAAMDVSMSSDVRHKSLVEAAVKQGKHVPLEVMAEYPELAKFAPTPAEPVTKTAKVSDSAATAASAKPQKSIVPGMPEVSKKNLGAGVKKVEAPTKKAEMGAANITGNDAHTLTADVPKAGKNYEGRYLKAALEPVKEKWSGVMKNADSPEENFKWMVSKDVAAKGASGAFDLRPEGLKRDNLFVKVPDDGAFKIPNTPKSIDHALKAADRFGGNKPSASFVPKVKRLTLPNATEADHLKFNKGLEDDLGNYEAELANNTKEALSSRKAEEQSSLDELKAQYEPMPPGKERQILANRMNYTEDNLRRYDEDIAKARTASEVKSDIEIAKENIANAPKFEDLKTSKSPIPGLPKIKKNAKKAGQ